VFFHIEDVLAGFYLKERCKGSGMIGLGAMAFICKSSTWEVEIGGSQFKASLGKS
jgi:hypothetical protein